MAARAVVFAAAQHGVAPPDLCKQVGLDPTLLADNDGRIPASVMVALWEAVSPLDPDFGLHLAEMSIAAQPALPWHLVRASSNLAEGILRLVAAWRIFNDIHPPELTLPGEYGVLRMRTKNTPLPVPRHAAEYAFGWFVIAARRATGIDVRPIRVTFEHAAPSSSVAEHARIFGCEVAFDDDASSIVFAADVLALPTKEADPELVQILEKHAEALLAKLPQRGGFASQVRAAMTPLLAGGDVSIDRVAASLATSSRSVQRRLHDENTSFQRVLDELRREVATEYLGDRAKSIAEVALLLGFSDQTAFHRAFVRWTGRTPGDVRRGASGGGVVMR